MIDQPHCDDPRAYNPTPTVDTEPAPNHIRKRPLITKALDHYHAYTVTRNAEDKRYQDLADLKLKPTDREPATQPAKHAKRRA